MNLNSTRTRYRNWLNRRARTRGRAPLPDRIARQFSGLPGRRNRINPATGRPHRDDKRIGAVTDRSLAQQKTRADARSARAAASRQSVRDTLAKRQPQFAQALDRASRDVSRGMPRQTRSGRSR